MAARNLIEMIARAIDRASPVLSTVADNAERMQARVSAAAERTAQIKPPRMAGILSDPNAFLKVLDEQERLLARTKPKDLQIRIRINQAETMAELKTIEKEIDLISTKAKDSSKWVPIIGSQVRNIFSGGGFAGAFIGAVAAQATFAAVFAVQRAILGIGDALYNATKRAKEFTAAAERTGIAVTTLQEIEYAGQRVEVSLSTVRTASRTLARVMQEDSAVFKVLGIETRDTSGHLRSVEDVMFELSDVFKSATNDTDKMSLGLKVFGRAGTDILPMMELGSSGLRKWADEARNAGLIMSPELVAKLDELNDRLERTASRWKGFTLDLKVRILRLPVVANTLDALDPESYSSKVQARLEQLVADRAAMPARSGHLDTLKELTAAAEALVKQEMQAAQWEERGNQFAKDPAVIENWKKREKAIEDAKRKAEEFAATVQRIKERVEARDLSGDQMRDLALGFIAGKESVESLLRTLHDETATQDLIKNARFLKQLIAEYGAGWKVADDLSKAHTRTLTTTEAKMQAVNEAIRDALGVGKTFSERWETVNREVASGAIDLAQYQSRMAELNKEADALVKKVRQLKTLPDISPKVPVPRLTAPGVSGDFGKTFEFLAKLRDDSRDTAQMLIDGVTKMDQRYSAMIDKWTEKIVAFGGEWGFVMELIVSTALHAFQRALEARIFDIITNFFNSASGGAGSSNISGGSGTPGGQDVPGGGSFKAQPAPGPTTVINNRYDIKALDTRSVYEAETVPSGSLRNSAFRRLEVLSR